MAADTTLTAIRTKVRRLTKSLSVTQITDNQIDEYINAFVEYDFPEHLKHLALRSNFTFYTKPYIDIYETSEVAGTDFYDFKNLYLSVHGPVYVAGSKVVFTQDEKEFYGIYPKQNTRVELASGDGVTAAFNGTLTNKPIVANNVTISAYYTDADNFPQSLEMHDNGEGALAGLGGTGTINYVTGEWTLNFTTSAPANDSKIYMDCIPHTPSKPSIVLYYDCKFVLRPIPDRVYKVEMEAYKKLSSIAAGESPYLKEWFHYIAYGAEINILEDRQDFEGVNAIMPKFKEQELLVNRRTIVQQTEQRVSTIYTDIQKGSDFEHWGINS